MSVAIGIGKGVWWPGLRRGRAQVLGAVVCYSKAHMGNTSAREQKCGVCVDCAWGTGVAMGSLSVAFFQLKS